MSSGISAGAGKWIKLSGNKGDAREIAKRALVYQQGTAVNLFQGFISQNVGRSALAHDPTVLQEQETIRVQGCQIDVVGYHDDGGAAIIFERFHQVHKPRLISKIQRGGGLVQQDDFG